MNNDLTCICQAVFCKICKAKSHPSMNCLENSYQLPSGFGETLMYCKNGHYCFKRENTYFIGCEIKESFVCLVCNLDFNLSDHKTCILLFSGKSPNISYKVEIN